MCYTAISSPRQSGVPCLLRTFSSLSVSSSVPQPKISISSSSSPSSSLSSLSSVFDSYSEAMPDSRNLAKSRQPRDLTSRDDNVVMTSETSGLSISSLLALSDGGGEGSRGRGPGGPGRKRKHSSLSRHWSLPRGLPRVPLEEEKALLVPSLVPSAARLRADTSGFGVMGSQITGGNVDRKVISNKLSWDPTGERRRGRKTEGTEDRNKYYYNFIIIFIFILFTSSRPETALILIPLLLDWGERIMYVMQISVTCGADFCS